MTRSGFVLAELGRNLVRSPLAIAGSLLAVTLLFILLNIFWIAAISSQDLMTRYVDRVNIEAFVSEEIPDSSVSALDTVLSRIPAVAQFTYISRDSARQELIRLVGTDLLAGYDSTNPLPRSFVIVLRDTLISSEQLAGIDSVLSSTGMISDVYYNDDRIRQVESMRVVLKRVGSVLGGLIVLSALLNLTNGVRLSTRTRATGLRQMRLLGASKLFLSAPYLIEGFLLGGLSAGASWAVIFYWSKRLPLNDIVLRFPEQQHILLACLATAFLGLVSGFLGVRKALR